MAAYDAYLVGRAFLNARTAGYQDKAVAAFEEAIRLDENYAPPYAGLAAALELDYGNEDRVAARASAVRAVETAIELDPELADGHAALGLILLGNATEIGDTQNNVERAERSLRRALDLDPTLTNAYNWLSATLASQGRNEEADAVQKQGLLVDPLNPILSFNMANRLRQQGKSERSEQMLLRLTYLPEPPELAYTGLAGLFFETGKFDGAVGWTKQAALAFKGQNQFVNAFLAGCYERLGLTEDADYWVADVMAHTPQPAQNFVYKAIQFQIRGDRAGISAEIDRLRKAIGSDVDELKGFQAGVYGSANIYVENFDVGIEVLERVLDVEWLSVVTELGFWWAFEISHSLAYAYQQVGRDDDANELLTRLHGRLNELVVERHMDFGPVHQMFAQNFGLRGDFDAAADALETAIKAGWLQYIWVMNNPAWAETIADPRIARMLEDVKVELERQRAVVEQTDAEHDFRAELEAKRSALDD